MRALLESSRGVSTTAKPDAQNGARKATLLTRQEREQCLSYVNVG